MLVENLTVPFDRRVWMEATTLAMADYQVSVICPGGRRLPAREVRDGIHIYRYPLPSLDGFLGHLVEYGIALPATFLLALWVWWARGYDVIHAANPPDLFFPIAVLFRIFGVKFIFDHHDLVPETCETRWSGWKLRLIRSFSLLCERFSYRAAHVAIVTNESYRDVAIRRGRKKPEEVFVVRSGPRMEHFSRRPPSQYLKEGRSHLVCYLGVMGANDGVEYVLHAANYVVNTRGRRDVLFALIGAGDRYSALRALCSSLGLDDAVRFTGRIPDEELLAYLSTADVGVAPDPKDALNDVSTMNKIVEYMAVGLPVVAFDLKEARVSAGEAGAFAAVNDAVALGDLLLKLIDDPERLERMSRAAIDRFTNALAWDHQAGRLLQAYVVAGLGFGLQDGGAAGRPSSAGKQPLG